MGMEAKNIIKLYQAIEIVVLRDPRRRSRNNHFAWEEHQELLSELALGYGPLDVLLSSLNCVKK